MWLGFAVGLVASNAFEWAVHKHVLHGLGANKKSFWGFHWHEHHKNVRKSGGFDEMYLRPMEETPSKRKEVLGVVSGALLSTPLLAVAPGFVLASWASAGAYYYVHRKSHVDPAWGRKYVPWHVDHHLGPDQHKNWCVTYPLFDWVMGTREPFVGTEREQRVARATVVEAPAQL